MSGVRMRYRGQNTPCGVCYVFRRFDVRELATRYTRIGFCRSAPVLKVDDYY